VGLRAPGDGRAGFSGVTSCGSVWACPVCASKIAAERANDLGQVAEWAVDQGHTIGMVTLTVQHHPGQRLAELWDAVTGAWSDVVKGEAWSGEPEHAYLQRLEKWETDRANRWTGSRRRARPVRRVGLAERFGVLGWARAVEVLHGLNGWHPHVHVPVVIDGPVSEGWIRLFGEAIFDRFQRALRRRGFDAVRDSGGLDARRAYAAEELGGYLAKQLAFEATHGHVKTGRNGSELRAPFQVLADLTSTGDVGDLDIWREWEKASKGRQQLTWSAGIRAMGGLAEQQRTDEQIADDEPGDDDLLILDRDTWHAIAPIQHDLLAAAAKAGLAGAIIWLDQTGLTYTVTSAGQAALGRRQVDAGRASDDAPERGR
jgi:hypothetical protein